MISPSEPVLYTDEQIRLGVNRVEVVANQTSNNALWDQDRAKLVGLQNYLRALQSEGIISK